MIDATIAEMTERAVLFAALQSERIRNALLATASVDWFHGIDHRKIIMAMQQLVAAGKPFDELSLHAAIRAGAKASFGDVVIDPEWFREARDEQHGRMSVEALVDNHLPLLHSAYQSRRLFDFFSRGAEIALERDAADLLTWTTRELEEIQSSNHAKSKTKDDTAIVIESMRDMDIADEDTSDTLGPLTGLPSLDRLGFRLSPRQLITIAGRPGECKTLLKMHMALGASSQVGVACFELEDGIDGYRSRRIAILTGSPEDDVRRGVAPGIAYERRSEYVAKVVGRPLYVVDGMHGMTSLDIVAKMAELKSRDPKLGVVFVDQTYDILDYDKVQNKELLTYAIARCVHRLLAAARSLGLCLVLLQHVKQDVLGPPKERDIADSFCFAKRSRKVVMVSQQRDEKDRATGLVRADIVKWTHGQPSYADLAFDGAAQRLDHFVDPMYVSDHRLATA